MFPRPRWRRFYWPLFAAVMGFAFGGSVAWSIYQPKNKTAVEQHANSAESPGASHAPPKSTDERIADYAWWLDFFTFALVATSGVTIFFLIRADRTARIAAVAAKQSANAAEKTARALQEPERPYIFIWGMEGTIPSMTFASKEGPPIIYRNTGSFSYTISNRGNHTAIIDDVKIACGYPRLGSDPHPPLTGIADHELIRMPLLTPGAEHDRRLTHFQPWNWLDPEGKDDGFRDGLIFQVVIAYHGPFTRGHKTSECWRYIASMNGFAEVADERYTYSS